MENEKIVKKISTKRVCKPRVTKEKEFNNVGDVGQVKDIITEKVNEGIAEIEKFVKFAKEKYEKTDEKTKHQFLAGVAGAAALLGAVVGIKAIKKKKK
jgi:hypothetical protein